MFGFLVFEKRMISTLFRVKPTVLLSKSEFKSSQRYFRRVIFWKISGDKVASLLSERREQ